MTRNTPMAPSTIQPAKAVEVEYSESVADSDFGNISTEDMIKRSEFDSMPNVAESADNNDDDDDGSSTGSEDYYSEADDYYQERDGRTAGTCVLLAAAIGIVVGSICIGMKGPGLALTVSRLVAALAAINMIHFFLKSGDMSSILTGDMDGIRLEDFKKFAKFYLDHLRHSIIDDALELLALAPLLISEDLPEHQHLKFFYSLVTMLIMGRHFAGYPLAAVVETRAEDSTTNTTKEFKAFCSRVRNKAKNLFDRTAVFAKHCRDKYGPGPLTAFQVLRLLLFNTLIPFITLMVRSLCFTKYNQVQSQSQSNTNAVNARQPAQVAVAKYMEALEELTEALERYHQKYLA